MRNLKSTLSYNLSSENSYLKLFQIANQNLSLVIKEDIKKRPDEQKYPGKRTKRNST